MILSVEGAEVHSARHNQDQCAKVDPAGGGRRFFFADSAKKYGFEGKLSLMT